MNIFKKNNILIEGLISDSYNFIQRTYNQSRNVFTVASAWGQILYVLQNISQLILYFIEDSITELNINEASRDYSIKSLARISGYDPGRATCAQGEISIKWNLRESDVGGGSVIINSNTKIRCNQNGLIYTIILNSPRIKIPLVPSQGKRFKIVQGGFKSAKFTGNGRLLQSFNVPSRSGSYIDQFFVNVFVNEEKWERYDSLYDIPLSGKGFITKMGIQNGIDIYFGNGNFGEPPEKGSTIRVEYLETLGPPGNLVSTQDNPLTFSFVGSGEDTFGNEVNLQNYLQIENLVDPSFGTSPESVNLIRLVAPRTSRSFVFANASNYEIFLEKLGVFSQISAFSTFDDDNLEDDNVIYIFLVPDVTLNLESNEDYFDLEAQDFFLTNSQRTQILNLIEDSGSMIATTVVKILEPTISKYVGNAVLTIFEGYDEDVIKDNIRDAVSDYFLNLRRRDRVPKSDIIAILEGVPGIDSVNFYFIGQKNEANQSNIQDLKNLSQNEKNNVLGLNEYGDIVIAKDELILMRGGFSDRYGTYYEEGIVENKPCSLNITITERIPRTYSSERNAQQKTELISKNTSR